MRLGARNTLLDPHSKAYILYDKQGVISERHRHRYEVNPAVIDELEEKGLFFTGMFG